MTDQARTEMLQKKELQAQLDEFRKAQYETELQMAGGSTTSLENLPKVEDIVVGGWKASGRKRKKAVSKSDANTGGVGLPMKIRKTSSAGEKAEGSAGGEKDTAISAQPTKVASDTNGPDKESMRPSEPPSIVALASVNTAKNPDPETHPLNPKTATSNSNPSGGGLLGGLVTYSSEEDDD